MKEETTGKNLAGPTEEDVFRLLGLPYIEPELREDRGEIAAAEAGTLPRIVPYDAVRGDLHVHTQWSDGKDTIRDMAIAAKSRGYGYIAICDHERSPEIDRGLTEEKIVKQRTEIEQLNRELEGITVLQGIEANIGEDGTLGLPAAVLGDLDLVVASIHSGLRMHATR